MVLHGFVDDSRTSDGPGNPNAFVLGGFLAEADDWIRFSDELEEICNSEPKTPDWHMAEGYRLKGRFKWEDEHQRDARIKELITLVKRHVKYRVDAVVLAGNYDLILKGKLPPEIDDPYFICFYLVILAVANYMNNNNIDGKVDWVFDDQGALGVECVRWYQWIREHVAEDIRKRLGSTPIFKHDREVLPLKAADIYAWHLRRYLAKVQPVGIPHSDEMDALLSIAGVSCQARAEHLQQLLESRGVLFTAKCLERRAAGGKIES